MTSRIHMRKLLLGMVIAAPIVVHPGVSLAKGCLKGAAAGAVAGHLAGHHAVAGAAVGCVIGHHHAKVKDRDAAQAAQAAKPQARQPAPANPTPKNGGDWL